MGILLLGFISQDKALSEAVLEQMKQAEGWQCALFDSPQAALDVWTEAFPPLVLWDTKGSAPDMAARFHSVLRGGEPRPWLLVLGDLPFKTEESEGVDYLVRPLRLGKLLSRLQFYKRRLLQPPEAHFSLGPFVFHPRRRLLCHIKTTEEIKLTDKETALLEYLVTAQKPVSKNLLLEEIWGYGHQIDTHTLETHIYLLRQKLMSRNSQEADCFTVEQGCYGINSAWAGI